MKKFQQDLLESVRQMKRGEAARVATVKQRIPKDRWRKAMELDAREGFLFRSE